MEPRPATFTTPSPFAARVDGSDSALTARSTAVEWTCPDGEALPDVVTAAGMTPDMTAPNGTAERATRAVTARSASRVTAVAPNASTATATAAVMHTHALAWWASQQAISCMFGPTAAYMFAVGRQFVTDGRVEIPPPHGDGKVKMATRLTVGLVVVVALGYFATLVYWLKAADQRRLAGGGGCAQHQAQQPAQPAQPAQPMQPAQPAQPTQPAQPAQPTHQPQQAHEAHGTPTSM